MNGGPTQESVINRLHEFDKIGRQAFLKRHANSRGVRI